VEQYRRDVDGLRAVAVIAVVLYHAGVTSMGGGYVGVDVFFVISGYLITKYVDQRIQDGRFRIVEFYERRVRRIMPALFFLLIVASVLGYFALFPSAFYDLAKSQIATTIFSPNLLLYRDAGYFDGIAKLKPLLHMWSLGVEEQFYIFLPLTMMLAARGGRRGTLVTLYVALVGSLALSIWGVKSNPSAAFYLVPFRAWELLLGSLIGVRAFPRISNTMLCNALSAVGLLLILFSVFFYTSETAFPGVAALAPCLGTAFIIYANEDRKTLTGRLLSWGPMVGIGLISYSLYLWHWPLLVFLRHYLARPLSNAEAGIVVVVSLAAAILSWKFVEQPFRVRAIGASRPALFSIVAAVAAVVLVLGAVEIAAHGLPQRLSPQARQYASGITDRDHELAKCGRSTERIEKGDLCRLGSDKAGTDQAGPVDFVLWGDSHAGALAPVFKTLANETGVAGWLATEPGCAPLLGVETITHNVSGCDKFNGSVISAVEHYNVRTVYLVARWELDLLGRTDFENSEGVGGFFLSDSDSKEISRAESGRVLERGLNRTLSRLARGGHRVVLVLDVPNTAIFTPAVLAKSATRGMDLGPEVIVDVRANGGRLDSADDFLKHIGAQWQATTIDPKASLCKGAGCLIAKNGRSLYTDDNHLTTFGALQLIDLIRPSVTQAGSISHSARAVATRQPSEPSASLQSRNAALVSEPLQGTH